MAPPPPTTTSAAAPSSMYHQVRHRKRRGSLVLTDESLVFACSVMSLQIEWRDILTITANIASSPTPILKLDTTTTTSTTHGDDNNNNNNDGRGYKFAFVSRSILEQVRSDMRNRWKTAHEQESIWDGDDEDFSETKHSSSRGAPLDDHTEDVRYVMGGGGGAQRPSQPPAAASAGVTSSLNNYPHPYHPSNSNNTLPEQEIPTVIPAPLRQSSSSRRSLLDSIGSQRSNSYRRQQQEPDKKEGSQPVQTTTTTGQITVLPHDQIMVPRHDAIDGTRNGHYLLDFSTLQQSQQVKVTPVNDHYEEGPCRWLPLDATIIQTNDHDDDNNLPKDSKIDITHTAVTMATAAEEGDVFKYNDDSNNHHHHHVVAGAGNVNVVEYKDHFYFAGYRISKGWCLGSLLFVACCLCLLLVVAIVMVVLLFTTDLLDDMTGRDDSTTADNNNGGIFEDDFYAGYFERLP